MKDQIIIGSIVKAKAGRDKNGIFVVKSVDKDYALITDGKTRKVIAPKKKKIKHIEPVGFSALLGERFSRKEEVGNQTVKIELKKFLQNKIGG